jgi:hypothetical protein
MFDVESSHFSSSLFSFSSTVLNFQLSAFRFSSIQPRIRSWKEDVEGKRVM